MTCKKSYRTLDVLRHNTKCKECGKRHKEITFLDILAYHIEKTDGLSCKMLCELCQNKSHDLCDSARCECKIYSNLTFQENG